MDYTNFGRYLSQQRQLRGVTLEEVCACTQMPPEAVEALEAGQLERLSQRASIIDDIRAYAEAIGLESEDTVLRFEEIQAATPLTPKRRRQKRPRLAWLVGGAAALLTALAYAVVRSG